MRPEAQVAFPQTALVDDNVLYHSLTGLARSESFRGPLVRNTRIQKRGPIYLWEGLFAPAVTNTTRLTNRNPPVMCAGAPTTGGISILLILVPTEAIQQRCHEKRLADSWRQAKRCLKIC